MNLDNIKLGYIRYSITYLARIMKRYCSGEPWLSVPFYCGPVFLLDINLGDICGDSLKCKTSSVREICCA